MKMTIMRVGMLGWLSLVALQPARAVFNDWTNSAGGEWENTGNWSLGRLPISSDDVRINASGTYTVHIGENAALNYPNSFTCATFNAHNTGGRITLNFDYTNAVPFTASSYLTLGDATLNWNTTNRLNTYDGYLNYFPSPYGTQAVINIYGGYANFADTIHAGNATLYARPVVNLYGGYLYLGSGRGRLPYNGEFVLNIKGGKFYNYFASGSFGVGYPASSVWGTGRILVDGGVIDCGSYADGIRLCGTWGDSVYGGVGQLIVSNGVADAYLIVGGGGPTCTTDVQLVGGVISNTVLYTAYGYYSDTAYGNAIGTLTISGGTYHMMDYGYWYVGSTSNSVGRVYITGGDVTLGAIWLGGANHPAPQFQNAIGEMYVQGGVARMHANSIGSQYDETLICVGACSNGVGRLFINGGTLDMSDYNCRKGGLAVGSEAFQRDASRIIYVALSNDTLRGEVTVTSGSITSAPVAIGRMNGIYPSTFSQYGGTVRISVSDVNGGLYGLPDYRYLLINRSGAYTFKGGTLEGGIGSDVRVTGGRFQGYGEVLLQDQLWNDGRVIADGADTNGVALDRTLSFTNLVGGVTNSVDNTSSNGWYAINHGKLTLAAQTVPAGSSTLNWGEQTNDASIDLISSARLVFTGASAGTLTGSLLATNHTSVPAQDFRAFYGVWQFSGPAFTSATLTFRYDDLMVAALGQTEDTLKVLRSNGGAWEDVTGTIDASANTITSDPVTSLGFFAVVTERPGTVMWVK